MEVAGAMNMIVLALLGYPKYLQIYTGMSHFTDMVCMEYECGVLLQEDFVERVLQNSKMYATYKQSLLAKYSEVNIF